MQAFRYRAAVAFKLVYYGKTLIVLSSIKQGNTVSSFHRYGQWLTQCSYMYKLHSDSELSSPDRPTVKQSVNIKKNITGYVGSCAKKKNTTQ